ncbi:hypothetical protein Tco_0179494 [Tanacetum coccineum]
MGMQSGMHSSANEIELEPSEFDKANKSDQLTQVSKHESSEFVQLNMKLKKKFNGCVNLNYNGEADSIRSELVNRRWVSLGLFRRRTGINGATSGQDLHGQRPLVSDLLVRTTEPIRPLRQRNPCLTAKASQIHEQDSHSAESSPSDGLTTAPKMVINSPCLNGKKELAIPEQTATGKESTNLLMADSLPKTIMPTKLVKPQGFNLRPNMVATTETTKSIDASKSAEELRIQPQTASAEKVQETIVEEGGKAAKITSLEDATIEKADDDKHVKESPYDTESEIKFIKRAKL